MAISAFTNDAFLVASQPIFDLQQLGTTSGHFDERSPFTQDSKVTQVRAQRFFRHLERTLSTRDRGKSSVQALLERTLKLPQTEENEHLFAQITQAFFKQKGYISRLFSHESWEEWSENRTSLGKVVSQFRDCIENGTRDSCTTKKLDRRVIQQASEEADALLRRLEHRDAMKITTFQPNHCLAGFIGGTAASFLTKNPLFFLSGLSTCLPWGYAQQKVGSEFQVNTYTTGIQSNPSVVSFSNDNFVVTWVSIGQDGSDRGVYGQIFDENGSKVGSEFQVNTYTNNTQWNPSVTSFSNNNFVVTWQSEFQDGSFSGIFGQLFNENVTKIGNEFQTNTYTNNSQAYPSVASFNNSNFVVTWSSLEQDGSSWGVYGQLFNESGTKIGSEFQVNTYTNNSQWNPSVTSFSNNNFVVTWASNGQDGSFDGIYGQIFHRNGTKIGNEFQVNTYTFEDQKSPSVASFENGNFIVTWRSSDSDSDGIFGQLFDAGANKIGNEFQVNTYTNDLQWGPSVGNLSNGNFVVTWTSYGQDGSDSGIFGQIFDQNGTNIGSEFQVNTYIVGDQTAPSVATLNDNFVVTWASNRQDGSELGIFGQIFHDNITTSSTTSTTTSFTSNFNSISRTKSSIFSPSFETSKISSNIIPTSSNPNNRLLWLWLLLGISGGVTCIGLGYFLLKKRSRAEARTSTELESFKAHSIRSEKGHTRIEGKYDLINKISRKEALDLQAQTGITIEFPEGENRTKVLFGRGNFGKIRLARDLEGHYIGVKKVKGAEQIAASRNEGAVQNKLSGNPNIMPILDFVETIDSNGDPVLYQFMPLAGFGNGEDLEDYLKSLWDPNRKEQILSHVAKGLLTGFSHMHKDHIYHIDIKPANMVLNMQGELFIIDFGCAKELPDGQIQERMTGDTRYFSPERLALYRQIRDGHQPDPIAADKVDAWALGMSLLELATGDYPFDRTPFSEKVERWDNAYFQQKLDAIPLLIDPDPNSVMTIVKGLLEVDPQKRLSIEDALAQLAIATPFLSLEAQQAAFAELKQQVPSSERSQEPPLPREQDENYEHVFAERYGYKFTPDVAPPPTETDGSENYTNPIPLPGDSTGDARSVPPPDEYE